MTVDLAGPPAAADQGRDQYRDHRLMVGAGAALIGTCYGLARFAYGLFAPEFRESFAFGPAVSGLVGAGSYVGYSVAIVAALLLTERLGARRVATAAGVLATVGTALVALAPSTAVLAVGVLVAGSSTGVASPPLAAAVGRWVRGEVRDRAQTVVNAGTGVGVLVSGPVALLLVDQWRLAWGLFSVLAAAVTLWVHVAVPATDRTTGPAPTTGPRGLRPGTAAMVTGAFGLGLASTAVWTLGRDVVTTLGGLGSTASTSVWIFLGAAGLVGALAGDLVGRLGAARAWTLGMLLLAGSTTAIALAPGVLWAVFAAAAVFGAAYIGLSGVVLLWGTRIYPDRSSFGVGAGFLVIAVGQAVGAALAGVLTDYAGVLSAFVACSVVAVVGAAVRPRGSGANPG